MLITIGITTYDRVDYLEDAIISVLMQSVTNFRLIVSNDNPDRTIGYHNLEIPRDARIEFVNQKINMGEIANLNWLMNQASTPYFTWLADDDLLHPKFLELLLAELENSPECKAAYSNHVSGETPPSTFSEFPVSNSFQAFDSQEFLLRYSENSLNLIGCYGLFETDLLRKIEGFKTLGKGYSPLGDTLIPIILTSYTRIHYTDFPLIFFRSHPGSMSISAKELTSFTTAEFDFIAYAKNSIDMCSQVARRIIYINFRKWFQDNHLTVAKRQAGSNVSLMVRLFLNSERTNYLLFRPYNLGAFQNILFSFRAVYLLFYTIARICLIPNMRRRLRKFLK